MHKLTPMGSVPLISIITATYNAEKLLPETIKSIKNLKNKNFEWIIVDGASSDNTVNLIRSNSDVISNWISEPDQGIYDAWNKGVSLSRGEWIAFIGAGDTYLEDALICYSNLISRLPSGVNFISSRVEFTDSNGTVKKTWGCLLDIAQFKKIMSIAHVGALHHKSLFDKNKRFDIVYKSAADYDFLLSNIDIIKPAFLNKVTAKMIIGGSSDSYFSLLEKYKIQRKYLPLMHSEYHLLISCSKKALRKIIKGY